MVKQHTLDEQGMHRPDYAYPVHIKPNRRHWCTVDTDVDQKLNIKSSLIDIHDFSSN